MFNLFKRRSGGSNPIPSLDSVRFDTSGYQARGDLRRGHVRGWVTPEGDGVGLYLFPMAPDLPQSARCVDDLSRFYEAQLKAAGAQLVEISLLRLDGCPAVRLIMKTPQPPSGMSYVGSLTLPFRDFSFVIKVQCEEGELTGLREAVLLDRRLGAGEMPAVVDFVEGRSKQPLPGWNPDEERFDAEFPQHPVSRVRRVLRRVAGSLTVEAAIKGLPGFALPETPA